MRGHHSRLSRAAGLALFGVVLVATAACAEASWIQLHGLADGKVTRVVDGDTVAVDVWGDGTTAPQPIRNAGIQAMEVGQCHSAEATAAMSAATFGKQVRLSANDADASSLGRPVRFVDRVTATGVVDAQLSVLNAGQALPLVIPPETNRWQSYFAAAQRAAGAGRNLWDSDYCRPGPAQSTPIRVWVNYDGDGDERANPNLEYLRILNGGTTELSLTGWWLRTGAQDSFFFPKGTTVKPGSTVTLHAGRGTATATSFYWGNTVPRFPNADTLGSYGSGAYLFDPDGDLRAHAIYPCLVACGDPRIGKVVMDVNYDAPGDDMTNPNGEYVVLTLPGSTPVDLSYTVLSIHGNVSELGAGSILNPGEVMVIFIGKGINTRLVHYWGKPSALLVNAGGAMTLRTTEGIPLTCHSWGTSAC
jgi:endonuclease YncB( thermonuclease family)